LGEHILRAKTNRDSPVPDEACQGTPLGETEDYTVNIVLHIGIDDTPLNNSELIIKTLGENLYEISMESSSYNETLIINLHNVMGQKLVENRVENVNGKYVYRLDLSYAQPGAYIIRLGSAKFGKVKKILVK
jgi:hypothetical protein